MIGATGTNRTEGTTDTTQETTNNSYRVVQNPVTISGRPSLKPPRNAAAAIDGGTKASLEKRLSIRP